MADLPKQVRVADNVLVSEVGGEAVILDLKSESYFGLDAVGTRMWQVLTSTPSVQDALERLLDEYEVERDLLKKDLANLLELLTQNRLLEAVRG